MVDEFSDFQEQPSFPEAGDLAKEKILDFDLDLDLDKIQPTYKTAGPDKTEAKTAEGTSLEVVPESDFFSLLDAVIPDADDIIAFGANPLLYSYSVKPEVLSRYPAGIQTVLTSMKQENDRIENVLKDTLGSRYKGINASTLEGFDLFKTRDQLARKDFFEDRKKYFEDKYPGSTYMRVGVGGNKVEEVFSLVPDGDIYRIDPNGGFSDVTGEIGDATGTMGTLSTAGSIAGYFLHPFFGTAGGYVIGDMIDKQLAQEGLDLDRDEFTEQFSTSQLLQGIVEGAINQFAPGMGKYFLAKLKGEEAGVPFSMLLSKVPKEALEAQKFARDAGLPPLGIGQLATKSNLASKLYAQASGLSRRVTDLRLNQQEKILKKLEAKTKVEGGFKNFSQGELDHFIAFKGQQLNADLLKYVDDTLNMKVNPDSTKIFQKIIDDSNNLKSALDTNIDKKFLQASQKANSANAVFDLNKVVDKANEMLYGIRTRKKPKPTDKQQDGTIGLNVPEGQLGGQLQRLVNIINPEVKKLITNDLGVTKTFSALKQITTIRNDLAEIIKEGGSGGRQAKELVKLIDDAIANPRVQNNVFGKDMLKYLDEGKQLFKLRNGVTMRSSFANFFSPQGSLQPRKVVAGIFDGNVDDETFGLFFDFVKQAGKNKTLNLATQKTLKQDLGNAFITYATHNPAKAGEVIKNLMENQPGVLNMMFPSKQAQNKLKDFVKEIDFIDGSVFKQIQKKKLLNLETSKTFIKEASEAEIRDYVKKLKASPDFKGFNDTKLNELRHAVLDNIFKNPGIKGTSPMAPGVQVVNAGKLVDEINNLTNFNTEAYAKLKPLFENPDGTLNTQYIKHLQNIRNYTHFTQEALDTGGQMATGARVGALINNLDLGAIATIMKADLLAKVLSTPPSVAQLDKAINRPGSKLFTLETLTAVLNSIAREYQLTDFADPAGPETIDDEFLRTNQIPDVSALDTDDTTQVASNTITPNTANLNLSLPKVSGGGNVNPPNNQQYASLFPFDTTGTAIANRAGIMGLT